MYYLKHQMVQLHSWLYFTFKDLSNDTSHAQFRVKMKKLWPQQVKEEKQATEHKLCCDKASNKVLLYRNKVLDKVLGLQNADVVTQVLEKPEKPKF